MKVRVKRDDRSILPLRALQDRDIFGASHTNLTGMHDIDPGSSQQFCRAARNALIEQQFHLPGASSIT